MRTIAILAVSMILFLAGGGNGFCAPQKAVLVGQDEPLPTQSPTADVYDPPMTNAADLATKPAISTASDTTGVLSTSNIPNTHSPLPVEPNAAFSVAPGNPAPAISVKDGKKPAAGSTKKKRSIKIKSKPNVSKPVDNNPNRSDGPWSK
ncbi:MAG: hypothetical protein HQL27_04155 [Candidatus Omnitrophica bacterium]|nr:hypothetical protein [Candidatus Omnitrophota bacterium]